MWTQGQHFAVVFSPSQERVEKDWAKQLEREISAVETSTSIVARIRGEESARPSFSMGDGSSNKSSSNGNSSSNSSASESGTPSPPFEDQGDLDGGSELEDANKTVEEPRDGCSTTGGAVITDGADELPTTNQEADGTEAVEPGDNSGPAVDQDVDDDTDDVGGADDHDAWIGITSGSEGDSQDESNRATATTKNQDGRKEAMETDKQDFDRCVVVANKSINAHEGNGGAAAAVRRDGVTEAGLLQGPFYSDELLDKSDTESSDDDDDDDDRRRRRDLHSYLTDGEGWPLPTDASGVDVDTGGDSIEQPKTAREKRAALSWIVSRMGLLEKVVDESHFWCINAYVGHISLGVVTSAASSLQE